MGQMKGRAGLVGGDSGPNPTVSAKAELHTTLDAYHELKLYSKSRKLGEQRSEIRDIYGT